MTPEQIKAARLKLMLTESQFAKALNITPAAVNLWESGKRAPQGPAVKLIKLLVKYPGLLQEKV